jgi:hypothetical protein
MANRETQASGLSLLGYSTMLPIVWLSMGFLLIAIRPGTRTGIVGLAFNVLIVATFTSWLFVRKYRRHFSNREFWILVGFCSMWAALLESYTLFYGTSVDLESSRIYFVALSSFFADSILIVLGFRFAGRRLIHHYLAKHAE